MSTNFSSESDFRGFSLSEPVIKAIENVGYEAPSPIQKLTIPHVFAGTDVLAQAQTGTGKTAAFALPLLSRLDLKVRKPQVLVLVPTRELAIQVAESFERYASCLQDFNVLAIYGGQSYTPQLRELKRGAHVVVGTPGRVMDHMRRGTLKLENLMCLVLDEADEMLRMGFIEDVEWILEQTPESRQIALFSATIPKPIRRIAQRYLQDPEELTIEVRTTAAETINQRFWTVSGTKKFDALLRILEAESFDGIIIFVKTKIATIELAEKLDAFDYCCSPLNGDIPQNQRERTIERFRQGRLDILIATDVAARGLDVERVSHVINYDMPSDTEAYVHRVGRTGRAGRSGEAILFVNPRERRMLYNIERATRQKIEIMELPTIDTINEKRVGRFKQRITDTLTAKDVAFFKDLLEKYQEEFDIPVIDIAAALAKLAQGDKPLLLKERPQKPRKSEQKSRKQKGFVKSSSEEGMERFRIEVGHAHKVKPGNIVGAIANEAGLSSKNIGRIEIYDEFSTVDLPDGMPREVFRLLKKVWVAGQQLQISKLEKTKKDEHSKNLWNSKSHFSKKGKKDKSKHSKKRSSKKVKFPC